MDLGSSRGNGVWERPILVIDRCWKLRWGVVLNQMEGILVSAVVLDASVLQMSEDIRRFLFLLCLLWIADRDEIHLLFSTCAVVSIRETCS
jgi:hypothetical protein